jgi:hypothetical protein
MARTYDSRRANGALLYEDVALKPARISELGTNHPRTCAATSGVICSQAAPRHVGTYKISYALPSGAISINYRMRP